MYTHTCTQPKPHVPYTLERAPWALFSYLPERVGGLSRVGALSNVQNNVKIWALFLSERLGWALFREWAVFQDWALFQAYTVSKSK